LTVVVECSEVWKSYINAPRVGVKTLLLGKRTPAESRFSRHWALRDVSFRVLRGQGFGIIGHNGSGKTTLLSILLGTVLAERGSIAMRGRVASLIELGAGFHPELTGRDNIFLYGSILGMRLHEIRERYNEIVAFSELEGALEAPLRTYSSGMIARLGFSTIVNSPADILLVDEVLAVGDARFTKKCNAFLRDFKARNGTLVIVSHSMEEVAAMCDEGICLDMGAVTSSGPIWRVIDDYEARAAGRS
jgi:lipopolysaccharide transport system ATP-binding protein